MNYLVVPSPTPGLQPNTFLYYIKLLPGTPEEKNLIAESGNDDRIELYFYEAVNQEIGEDFELLRIQDARGWPHAILALVQQVKGLG